MSCDSISKGVFAFKGRKRKLDIHDYIPENDKTTGARYAIAKKAWLKYDGILQEIQDSFSKSVFEEISSYISHAYSSSHEDSSRRILKQLPVVALITGVNMPDHTYTFASLMRVLQVQVTDRIALVKSKDCHNLKQLMSSVISQLASSQALRQDRAAVKTAQCTMTSLDSWYRSVNEQEAPNTQAGSSLKPVVIIFEDFEAFRNEVLQDFFCMCSNHMHKIPIVLILGLATDVSAIHRTLSNGVTSLLSVEKFQAIPSTECLSLLMNRVLLTDVTFFKLSGRVFELLVDMFLFHDFSITNFMRCFQFCIMDHFLNNDASILCCPLDEALLTLKLLRHSQLEELLLLPSMRSYVDNRAPGDRVHLLENGKALKKTVEKLLGDLHTYHYTSFPVLNILHVLTRTFPGYPLGKQMRELYLLSLSDVTSSAGYKLSLELLRNLSKDELLFQLRQCCELLSNKSDKLLNIRERLLIFVENLQQVDGCLTSEENKHEGLQDVLPKKTDMYTLRKTLLEQKQKRLSSFEKLRKDIIDYLDQTFRDCLLSYKSLPLHEIFYFDAAATVRQHCNASPRLAIQTALTTPFYYIENESCNVSSTSVTPCLPDTCIAYKLHLECPRLINLYDWMLAFATVVRGNSQTDAKNPINTVVQARFIRAVSELQFLGFIKPTRAKTDHVARLTWGSC